MLNKEKLKSTIKDIAPWLPLAIIVLYFLLSSGVLTISDEELIHRELSDYKTIGDITGEFGIEVLEIEFNGANAKVDYLETFQDRRVRKNTAKLIKLEDEWKVVSDGDYIPD